MAVRERRQEAERLAKHELAVVPSNAGFEKQWFLVTSPPPLLP
jgi:hypothetical protein